jgi:hypothetical protein
MSKTRFLKKASSGLAMLALLSASSLCSVSLSAIGATDPVIFSFSTVGDTRQDPTKPDPTTLLPDTAGALLPQDAQWLQNTRAWARILRTVQSQKANLLFVNGDMIMGYGRPAVPSAWSAAVPATPSAVVNSDLVKFYTQYAYWRGMVANMFETNTYVMPVPGNHETQCNSAVTTNTGASACASGKHAYVENENAWRSNMGDLIGDLSANVRFQAVVGKAADHVSGLTPTSAPTSATDPVISTNQAELSYSFDINSAAGLLHFVVINTDAVGFDSHAPTGWLANDLANAKANGAAKFFIFGHKPAFTYDYLGNGLGTGANQVGIAGLDVDIPARNAFWKLVAQYNATYFSGHEHTTKIDTHGDQTNTHSTTPWQVLVGSGGSPFDPKYNVPSLSPTDRYYVWATVRVHQSGAVSLDAYGFNDGFGPTQLIQSISNLQ